MSTFYVKFHDRLCTAKSYALGHHLSTTMAKNTDLILRCKRIPSTNFIQILRLDLPSFLKDRCGKLVVNKINYRSHKMAPSTYRLERTKIVYIVIYLRYFLASSFQVTMMCTVLKIFILSLALFVKILFKVCMRYYSES